MLFVAIKQESSLCRAKGNGEARSADQLLYEVIFLQAPDKHETD